MKKTYKLENLNCNGCAKKVISKLETTLKFENTNYDIISKEITFDTKEKNEEKLCLDIQKVLDTFDHGIIIVKEDEEVEETKNIGKILIVKIILSSILIAINYIFEFKGLLQNGIFIVSYLIISYQVLITGIKNLFRKNFLDEFFLMSVASIAALFIQKYDEAIFVIVFYLVGEYFQEKALNASRKSISSLLNKNIKEANVMNEENQMIITAVKNIKINDLVLIKKGEIVPIDGILLNDGSFDTKSLTGEAIYKNYNTNEEVLSGYINVGDPTKIRVNKSFEESATSKINKLLKEASQNKSSTEKFITVFAKYYTPCVIVIAFLISLLGGIITGDYSKYIETGIIFLVVSCPCGLVLSIPLSYFVGIAKASKNGLLVKGGEYFDVISKTKRFVFDKTGTITNDTLSVKKIHNNSAYSNQELLKMVASIESFSNHPISKSIIESASQLLEVEKVSNFKEISGKGVTASYDNNEFILGNKKLLQENNIHFNSDEMFNIVINNQYIGFIEFENNLKANSKEVLSYLKDKNYEVIVLTGDNEKNIEQIKEMNTFDHIYHSLLPNEKYEKIKEMITVNKNNHTKTCYVGDGINDSICLKASDIGISMGKIGSDVAIEASDVVIIDDNLDKIRTLIEISHTIKRIVLQNIIFILVVKFTIMALGVFGYANILMGILADVVVSLLAILNSVRILKNKEH